MAEDIGHEVVLSTDYQRCLLNLDERVIFIDRPPRLATRDASMWDVLADLGQTLRWGRDDTIVLLQPTSLHEDRAVVIKTILRDNIVPAVTVERFPDKWHPWYALAPDCHNYPPASRHTLPERFRANGLAYILSGECARRANFWQTCPKLYEVPGVLNIDTPADWAEAVRIYG